MSSKSKNILLIIGFLLSLFICYKLAIKNTLDLKQNYTTLKQENRILKNTSKQLSLLKQKEKHYDSLLNKYQLKGSSVQNNLLKTINSFADNNSLSLVHFLEPHIIKSNNLIIKTYQFTLEGDYNDILLLVHKLEQQTKFGEITSLHFKKKKNFRTGKHYLQAAILLKSFG